MKALAVFLFGLLALVAEANCALSCRYIKPELDPRPTISAKLRFHVASASIWLWRVVLDAPGVRCTLRDFPDPAALSAQQSLRMRQQWAKQNQDEYFSPLMPSEAVPEGAVLRAPEGAPPIPGLRKHNLSTAKKNTSDRSLAIRLQQAQALIPPITFLNTAIRFGAHRCQAAVGGRGTAVLIAPKLALTAAHVVVDDVGALCEAYRAVPGGDSYLENEPSPLGIYISTKVQLSERGGWNVGKPPFPVIGDATQAQFEECTRHDWAIVGLRSVVRGPHVWPLLRFFDKPQTSHDCSAQMQDLEVVKIGYPIRGLYGETRRGRAIVNRGYGNCGQEQPPLARFLLFTNPGDSGAGVFILAKNEKAPLELRSLVSVSEMRNSFAIESLGPSFDLIDYQRMLGFLQNQP